MWAHTPQLGDWLRRVPSTVWTTLPSQCFQPDVVGDFFKLGTTGWYCRQPLTGGFDLKRWGHELFQMTYELQRRVDQTFAHAGWWGVDTRTMTPPEDHLPLVWGPETGPLLLQKFIGYLDQHPRHLRLSLHFLESKLFWLMTLPGWAASLEGRDHEGVRVVHPALDESVTRAWSVAWADCLENGKALWLNPPTRG